MRRRMLLFPDRFVFIHFVFQFRKKEQKRNDQNKDMLKKFYLFSGSRKVCNFKRCTNSRVCKRILTLHYKSFLTS